jgi:hypothetical protein
VTTTGRSVPSEIDTGCPELDLVWRTYAHDILGRPGVLIPDTDEDLTWHAFLGHSIDMQGFRAAEFAGVDSLSRPAPKFVPLKARGIGVRELATLWNVEPIRQQLLHGTRQAPFHSTLDTLRQHGESVGDSLADALEWFPWRKGHWAVRALLQNSAALAGCGYSFRQWIRHVCAELGVTKFPPADFLWRVDGDSSVTLEEALRQRVEAAFYMVGPALSAYMICDWQLWLWNKRRTAVFAMYKQDSFHEQFVARYGRGRIPADRTGFAEWWFSRYPEVPPRLANECIWLGTENGVAL